MKKFMPYWMLLFFVPNTKTDFFSFWTCFCFPRKFLLDFFFLRIFYKAIINQFIIWSHLSSQLVGSFIKKLSRLSLTCPPGDLRFLILFVFNLLIRHQNCKVIIHKNSSNKPSTSEKMIDDPFDVNCKDFSKTNALKSSLWEILVIIFEYFV